MQWKLSLSGGYTQCREQLNVALSGLTVHNKENAAKRAVADYVATEILDPTERKHMTDPDSKEGDHLHVKYAPLAAAKLAGPEPTLSINIALEVTST